MNRKNERYQIIHDADRFPIVVDSHDQNRAVFEDASLVACKLRAVRLNRIHREESDAPIIAQLAREFSLTHDEVLEELMRQALAFVQDGAPVRP